MTPEARAADFDAADPLAGYRERFTLPEGVIYLDGNSLGALPKATPARLQAVIEGEWGEGLIRSWNDAGWFDMAGRVGGKIAPLIGAQPHEVIACDSTSVNLFKLIAAALAMRPGRKVVLSEPGNFPTDLYMIAGLEAQGLATRRLAERDRLAEALGDDVALLMLTHAHYKTGALHDMAALTRAAHEAGALVLWDLSHSTGALPVDLNGVDADFAVGCGYKYLCGGPGAPAFAFVAERHHAALQQPLTGWFGHAAPFAFSDDYAGAPGIERLQCGTPPVLGLAALEVGVDLIAEIGVGRLYAKSQALSEFFLESLMAHDVTLELVSPPRASDRGSQLSFRHPEAYAICQALIARGVIGDFRAPDVLRLGFAPAYLSFANMAAAARHLAEVLASGEWQREEFNQRAAVT
ncbi:kynureninase [Erythrobacter sp. BLCC-B19]|uniref:kynureninase n=1 Tax=Erythrobacter sp. BLCC-B19 TaxID=3025315 RepID=UPI00235FAD33|nr:kynureninase [Erythrobacter sp. BLCC-B19]WDA42127.1 kynureninase [Erythrobacter sp. BLCC-B19]